MRTSTLCCFSRAMASDHSDSSHWSECDSFNIVLVDGIDTDGNMIPDQFMLEQSYPNPFNAAATIRYSLPKSAVGKYLCRELRNL